MRPPAGVYLIALSSSTRTRRRMAPSLPWITTVSSGTRTSRLRSFARAWRCSLRQTSSTTSARSTGANCSGAAPPSARARTSRSSTRCDVRSDSSWIRRNVSRYASGVRGCRSAISAAVRINAMGLRNSCEASAVNWESRLTDCSSLPNMSFHVSARRCSSSPVRGTRRRRERLSIPIERAASVISSARLTCATNDSSNTQKTLNEPILLFVWWR